MEQRQSDTRIELDVIEPTAVIPIRGEATNVPVTVETIRGARRTHYAPQSEIERMLDKSINLKHDICVVLVLAIAVFLQRVNATSTGYAQTGSDLLRQTHLQEDDIGDAHQLFTAASIVFAPLLTVAGRVAGTRNFLVGLIACSGVLTLCQAAIHGIGTLFSLQILLGVVQSSFLPTAWIYIAGVYPKQYIGYRMALFTGLHSLLGSFSGLLAFGLLSSEKQAMLKWQVLFLVDGFITILLAVISLGMLPDTAGKAWFLSPMEQRHAVKRMTSDTGSAYDVLGSRSLTFKDVNEVAKDWRKLCIVAFNCLATVPDGAFGTFLPIVLQAMGYTGIDEHLMGVLPFLSGFITLLIIAKFSDRWRERSVWITAGGCITIIGLVGFLASGNPIVRYIFIHLCIGGALLIEPLVAAWLAGNSPTGAQRCIILGINGWSEVSSVIAGQLFKDQYSPSYRYPLGMSLLLLGVSLGGFLMLRWTYSRLNVAREKDAASWSSERVDDENTRATVIGDHSKIYLYGY